MSRLQQDVSQWSIKQELIWEISEEAQTVQLGIYVEATKYNNF